MIILLDLNYTLVGNSKEKHKPFTLQIENETYRNWLVDLLAPYRTILMTARPELHKKATLESINSKTGWQPQESHFNKYSKPPPQAKQIMLEKLVFPKHGDDGTQYLAIESNPWTQAMYRKYGIASIKINENETWSKLPIP